MSERTPRNEQEFRRSAEPSADHSIVLTTNPYLEKLTQIVQHSQPDWEHLNQSVQKKGFSDPSRKFGKYGEIHLLDTLQRASFSTEFITRLIINPVPQGDTENYRFMQFDAGLVASDPYTKDHITEYDALIEIDGLPVVWEVKLGTNKSRKRKNGLNSSLNLKNINQRLAPLREYYGTNKFGFVVCTVPENISANSPTQKTFSDNGGLLISLALPVQELQSQTELTERIFDAKLHSLQDRFGPI